MRIRIPSLPERSFPQPFLTSPGLAEKGRDDQIMVKTALADGSAPISSCSRVVVYSAPPSERRRRWIFGKL